MITWVASGEKSQQRTAQGWVRVDWHAEESTSQSCRGKRRLQLKHNCLWSTASNNLVSYLLPRSMTNAAHWRDTSLITWWDHCYHREDVWSKRGRRGHSWQSWNAGEFLSESSPYLVKVCQQDMVNPSYFLLPFDGCFISTQKVDSFLQRNYF